MNYVYQITLKSVLLKENGWIDKPKGSNFLSTTLIYPRENIKSIESITELKVGTKKIQDNKELSFDKVNFSEKLLLKESIQGDSSLKVMITTVENVKKINNIILDGIKAGALIGISGITGGIGISVLTAVAKSFAGSILDSWKQDEEKDKKINILGVIDWPIDNNLKEGDLTLHLTTPKALTLQKTIRSKGKTIKKSIKIRKGSGIGKVVFEIKKHPRFQYMIGRNA